MFRAVNGLFVGNLGICEAAGLYKQLEHVTAPSVDGVFCRLTRAEGLFDLFERSPSRRSRHLKVESSGE